MTDQEMQIAIAEACGFSIKKGNQFIGRNKDGISDYLHDYLNDLNAIHEAEKTLQSENDRDEFCCYMSDIIERDNRGAFGGDSIEGNFWRIHATARQRTEAFLKTIGKWKD